MDWVMTVIVFFLGFSVGVFLVSSTVIFRTLNTYRRLMKYEMSRERRAKIIRFVKGGKN